MTSSQRRQYAFKLFQEFDLVADTVGAKVSADSIGRMLINASNQRC
jgi:hypothetical protein